MIGKTRADFWSHFCRLTRAIQPLARKKHRLWTQEPFHPSLNFKELTVGLWSVRVNRQYRALGRRKDDLVVWFWIGTHGE